MRTGTRRTVPAANFVVPQIIPPATGSSGGLYSSGLNPSNLLSAYLY